MKHATATAAAVVALPLLAFGLYQLAGRRRDRAELGQELGNIEEFLAGLEELTQVQIPRQVVAHGNGAIVIVQAVDPSALGLAFQQVPTGADLMIAYPRLGQLHVYVDPDADAEAPELLVDERDTAPQFVSMP